MRRAALLFVATALHAAEPSGDALSIMRKMADNIDAASEARRQYIYHQHVQSGFLKTNGQLICKESREYTVIPQATSTERKMVSFDGVCRQGNEMAPYSPPGRLGPGLREKPPDERGAAPDSGDREAITEIVDELATDPKSRDGIPPALFPLSNAEQGRYRFSLKAGTTVNGRPAHEIHFEPIAQKDGCADDCRPWKGEVWVDAEDLQPVRIDTQLAKGIPLLVRAVFGFNLHQLGFSLTYRRVAPGVWFPATYGTEFRLTLLWGYKRTITLSMENTDFKKTDAQSTIDFQ